MVYLRLRLPQAETDRPRLFRLFLATHSQESFAKQTPKQPTRNTFPGMRRKTDIRTTHQNRIPGVRIPLTPRSANRPIIRSFRKTKKIPSFHPEP